MNCDCDYDAPEFYNAEIRRAKREYRCKECHGRIAKSEQYERVTGKWDGSFEIFITCERCRDLRVWAQNNVPCLCVIHGNMEEEIKTAVDDAVYRAPNETAGLRFGMIRRMYARDKHNSQAKEKA